MALQDSSSAWNRLLDGLRADIPAQPAMLQGGQLREYQLEARACCTPPVAEMHAWLRWGVHGRHSSSPRA